ncbi:MAG: hypothetical protein COX80_01880 [Candidatus Magasanikbacteria bacterium CG_4_10_14_0_2_um_filter_33_14]|uniref:WYL domain-containing protein n=1 Tax=Candidatus Magasanikbacteria bacterium CG_4_10_14_0_2_um_filter_33_14 TaxID=1974636 RepID=A0A2M7VB28_9BACT|nr:MAG: hypothetical protein COX80_01880 [Candidatus Magasanikbacteria bacterium CG_4_10_14_0_2_um_filter_33_14]
MYNLLDTIKQSAQDRKILKISYLEKDGSNDGWRYVEPYSFSTDHGEDGLFAWDVEKDGIRRFSIERISSAEITDQDYTPRYTVEI